jgi:hypothetical protein
MRDVRLTPRFVEYMPDTLEQGVLYVSERFQLAIHLCACGECGIKTVTPFGSPQGWDYSYENGEVTLHPSIGNQQFPCRSHYWVRRNVIEWC